MNKNCAGCSQLPCTNTPVGTSWCTRPSFQLSRLSLPRPPRRLAKARPEARVGAMNYPVSRPALLCFVDSSLSTRVSTAVRPRPHEMNPILRTQLGSKCCRPPPRKSKERPTLRQEWQQEGANQLVPSFVILFCYAPRTQQTYDSSPTFQGCRH